MTFRWLEEHIDDGALGLDAAIADMLKTLSNPYHIKVLRLLSNQGKHRFNELRKALDLHPTKLSRCLILLQNYSLIEKRDMDYIVTDFGKHVLSVISGIIKQP